MIDRVCLLLEALSVIICLHYLYGEKFKLDIYTVCFVSIDIILMTIIKFYGLSKVYTVIIYPIIIVYCGMKFGFKLKELVINNVLYLVIIGGIQPIIATCYGWIFNIMSSNKLVLGNKELLIVNSGVLIIVLVLLPKFRIHRLSIYLQDKERILILFLFFCIFMIVSSLINYRVIDGLNVYQSVVLFIGITIFCALAGQLGKYIMKSKEMETEIKMNKLYSDSFNSLIEDIRLRQHEFDNHISTIYSLHYTCDTYKKLVDAQNKYSQTVIKENRFNKLLKGGNPLLIGFLYGKFVEIEKLGITITYQISIKDLNVNIPIYKLVEIIGNLIKNAVEAMSSELQSEKLLYVAISEMRGVFEIEIRNRSKFIDYNQIEAFFKKGFSKKGSNRGLGLYNVKNICNEYALTIFCENKNIDDENWLCFYISNREETI